MSYQLARIDYEHNRALGIFTKTKARFERAIQRAKRYIETNNSRIEELQDEVREHAVVNDTLYYNIELMQRHVEKINHLIGE